MGRISRIVGHFEMKILFVVLALSVMTSGQDCGSSWNILRVVDNNGQPIAGATIELEKAFKQDAVIPAPTITWDGEKHAYSMLFETCRDYTNANLRVNASGYEPILGQIILPLNSKEREQRFLVRLKRIGTKEIADIDTITMLTGTIYDANGAVVPNIHIRATDKRKRVYRTKTDGDGKYSMELPVGIYEISINQVFNFKFFLVKEFFVAPPLNKPMKLDYAIYW